MNQPVGSFHVSGLAILCYSGGRIYNLDFISYYFWMRIMPAFLAALCSTHRT